MANKIIKGLTVEIGGDTTQLGKAIDEADKKSKDLSTELSQINKLLKFDEANPELLAQKQKVLAEQIASTGDKLKTLKAAQEQATEAFQRGEVSEAQLRAIEREVISAENAMHKYENAADETAEKINNLGKSTEEASDEVKPLTDNVGKLGDAEKKTEKETGSLGDALKNALVAGAAAACNALSDLASATVSAAVDFAKESVEVGKGFDAAVSQVGATFGYTVEQLKGDLSTMSEDEAKAAQAARDNMELMRDKAQEMGAETSFSATEAAEGLNILAMSGYSAEQSCEMIGDVLNLAAAGSLSLADAAAYTSGAVKGFADETKDAQYYTDLMAKGATLANTDVKALGEALSGGSATAAAYGQNAESVTTSLLRLAEQGATGSEAATSLSRAMKDLYAPTDAAKKALEELGVSAYDERGNFKEMNALVDELDKALSKYGDEQRTAYKDTIFSTNGLNAFNKMTVTSTEKVKEWSDALGNAAGSAAAQAGTMLDNLQGDITVFGSAMEGAQIAISDALSPTLREFVQIGTEGISDLTKAFKEGGLEGALDAVSDIIGNALDKVDEILPGIIFAASDIINTLASQIPRIFQTLLPTVMDGITEIIGILAPALLNMAPDILRTLLRAAATVISGLGEILPGLLYTLVSDVIPSLITNLFAYLPDVIEAITDAVSMIAKWLPTIVQNLADYLPEIIDTIIYGITQSVPQIITALANVLRAVVQAIPPLIKALPSIAKMLISAITDLLPAIMAGVMELVGAVIDALPDVIQSICAVLPELLHAIVDTLLELIPQLIECGITLLTALIAALPQIISTICDALPALISGITSAILELVPQIIQCGVTLLTALVTALPDIIKQIVAVLPEIIKSIAGTLLDMLPMLVDCGVQLLVGLAKDLPKIITEIAKMLPDLIDGIISALLDALPQLIECGVQLFVALIQNLPAIIAGIVGAIPEIITALVDGFMEHMSAIAEVGSNIVKGLWEGIKDVGAWIKSKITGFFDGIVDGIKDFFGISSPSKLMRDQVGKNIALGVAEGISDEESTVQDAMDNIANDIENTEFVLPDVPEIQPPDSPEIKDIPLQHIEFESNLDALLQPLDELMPDIKMQQFPLKFESEINLDSISGSMKLNDQVTQIVMFDSNAMEKLDQILGAIEQGQVLTLDSEKLIGGTADKFNSTFGEMQILSERSV